MVWVGTIHEYAVPALLVVAALWVVLAIFGATRKRSLNLTTAETVDQAGVQPGFLKTDKDKREAALKGGEAFDAHVANRNVPPVEATPPAKAKGYAGMAAVLLAVVSLFTGAVSAMSRVEVLDETVRKFGIWDGIVQTATDYTLGFVVAIAVIAVGIFNVIRTARSDSA